MTRRSFLTLLGLILLSVTVYAQTLTTGGSALRWSTTTAAGKVFAMVSADYKRIEFTSDAAEMQVCMPSGQCRSVFEIAAWMEQPK